MRNNFHGTRTKSKVADELRIVSLCCKKKTGASVLPPLAMYPLNPRNKVHKWPWLIVWSVWVLPENLGNERIMHIGRLIDWCVLLAANGELILTMSEKGTFGRHVHGYPDTDLLPANHDTSAVKVKMM